MPEEARAEAKVERYEIDLSNVPLRPLSKREVQQLEMALIIGTLYRPEVLELIKDPLERATWVDSLAVAAAALAREKAGYTVPQIAEELGRSETTIRAHLQGKTKAGKLVRETYELLARGQLRLVVPFTGVEVPLEQVTQLQAMKSELERLRSRVKELEEENSVLRRQLEQCLKPEDLEKKLSELREHIRKLEEENKKLEEKVKELEKYRELVEEIKRLLESL